MLNLILPLAALIEPAPAPYRALGTEPFWALTIEQGEIRLAQPDRRSVRMPAPVPMVSRGGRRYVASGLTIDISYRGCRDGMSDRHYADTVTIRHGDRTLRGCGAPVRQHPISPG